MPLLCWANSKIRDALSPNVPQFAPISRLFLHASFIRKTKDVSSSSNLQCYVQRRGCSSLKHSGLFSDLKCPSYKGCMNWQSEQLTSHACGLGCILILVGEDTWGGITIWQRQKWGSWKVWSLVKVTSVNADPITSNSLIIIIIIILSILV
jgi:hypothetical protein